MISPKIKVVKVTANRISIGEPDGFSGPGRIFGYPLHLANDEIAVKKSLFMVNRLLQLRANAELRGMVL